MIAIVKGCGTNIASIAFALKRLGQNAVLTDDIQTIKTAKKVILPGVGHAQAAMENLQAKNLIKVIQELKQPVLGICLGMQILFEHSQEGAVDCLGLIEGEVMPLAAQHLPLPHMGWNQLEGIVTSPLLKDVKLGDYVYFVHSYAVAVNTATLAKTNYGDTFSAIVSKNNFYGTQFHPERSGVVGNKILQNFMELT